MSERQPLPSATLPVETRIAAVPPPEAGPDRPTQAAGQAEVSRETTADQVAPLPTMPTLGTWRAALDGIPLSDYLRQLDRELQGWHRARATIDTASLLDRVVTTQALVSAADRLFHLPRSIYDAIPEQVRWLIMDVGRAAREVAAREQSTPRYREAKHALARAAHHRERRILRDRLATAQHEAADRRMANTAQWVQQGLLRLILVTPTGDEQERLRLAGLNPASDAAFFPNPETGWTIADSVPQPPYSSEPTANDAVCLRRNGRGSRGWRQGEALVVTGDALRQGGEQLWSILGHAVQQDASRPGAEAVDSYRTVYRAYAYFPDAALRALDDTVANIQVVDPDDGEIKHCFSARQHAIFKLIHDEYGEIAAAWRENPASGGITFRQAVAAFRDPEEGAINRWNSPRIEHFYRCLEALPPVNARSTPAFKRLLKISFHKRKTRLDVDDAQTLLADSAARAYWTDRAHGGARKRLTTDLQRTTRGWRPWQITLARLFGL